MKLINLNLNNSEEEMESNALGVSLVKREPPKIRVVVRKRPLNSKEVKRGDIDILEQRSE